MDKEVERELFERGVREGRRVVTFGSVKESLDEQPRDLGAEVGEKIKEFKGRLRALTIRKNGT